MKFKEKDLVAVCPPKDNTTNFYVGEVLSSGPDGLLLERDGHPVPYTWEQVEQRKMFKVGYAQYGWFRTFWIYEDQPE